MFYVILSDRYYILGDITELVNNLGIEYNQAGILLHEYSGTIPQDTVLAYDVNSYVQVR